MTLLCSQSVPDETACWVQAGHRPRPTLQSATPDYDGPRACCPLIAVCLGQESQFQVNPIARPRLDPAQRLRIEVHVIHGELAGDVAHRHQPTCAPDSQQPTATQLRLEARVSDSLTPSIQQMSFSAMHVGNSVTDRATPMAIDPASLIQRKPCERNGGGAAAPGRSCCGSSIVRGAAIAYGVGRTYTPKRRFHLRIAEDHGFQSVGSLARSLRNLRWPSPKRRRGMFVR